MATRTAHTAHYTTRTLRAGRVQRIIVLLDETGTVVDTLGGNAADRRAFEVLTVENDSIVYKSRDRATLERNSYRNRRVRSGRIEGEEVLDIAAGEIVVDRKPAVGDVLLAPAPAEVDESGQEAQAEEEPATPEIRVHAYRDVTGVVTVAIAGDEVTQVLHETPGAWATVTPAGRIVHTSDDLETEKEFARSNDGMVRLVVWLVDQAAGHEIRRGDAYPIVAPEPGQGDDDEMAARAEAAYLADAGFDLAEAELAVAIDEGPAGRVGLAESRADQAARKLAWHRGRADDHRAGIYAEEGWTFESSDTHCVIVDVDGHGMYRVIGRERVAGLARMGRAAVLDEVAGRLEGDVDRARLEQLPSAVLLAMAGDFRDADDALSAAAGEEAPAHTGERDDDLAVGREDHEAVEAQLQAEQAAELEEPTLPECTICGRPADSETRITHRTDNAGNLVGRCEPCDSVSPHPNGPSTIAQVHEKAGTLQLVDQRGITMAYVPFRERHVFPDGRIVVVESSHRAAGFYASNPRPLGSPTAWAHRDVVATLHTERVFVVRPERTEKMTVEIDRASLQALYDAVSRDRARLNQHGTEAERRVAQAQQERLFDLLHPRG